jgi:hypothetical protein
LPAEIEAKQAVVGRGRALKRRPCQIAVLAAIFASALTTGTTAQENSQVNNPGKQARAVRVGEGIIRVDGRLDEDVWELVPPLDDFIQKEPIEGAPPSERMEVRFAYDSRALFVGFRMWSRDGATIQAPLGRRDVAGQSEHVAVSLDTYLDRRTAYTFGVTASGVRIDRFHPEDREEGFDAGFEPIWDARVSLNAQGWTAELWIPFSQLRFNDAPRQVWGVNIFRFTPTLNEQDYWILIPRTLRPDVNVDVYVEPFASSGRYYGFGELLRAGARGRLTYGSEGTTIERDSGQDWSVTTGSATFQLKNPDFAVQSLRGNVVLRWEWRPGTTLYLVWQQDRERHDSVASRAGLDDFFGAFSAPGRNFLAVKTSFWLPL